jgi:transposase
MNTHTHTPALGTHYAQLLDLTDPWIVGNTMLDTEANTLTIHITTQKGARLPCPTCNTLCTIYDHREERSWRHLDTMQFVTTIKAQLPRITCPEHGIATVSASWASEHSRFTLLFERFAIDVLKAATSITRAKTILRLSWDQLQLIKTRAVERGLKRRNHDSVQYVGIDEKNFLKGHHYASIATDLVQGRVLDVTEGRKKDSAVTLLNQAIPEEKRELVKAGAMDMWQPFMDAWVEVFGHDTPLVHDKFHVSGYLGKAVDSVRKHEHKALRKDGDDTLTKTKYLWLKNPDTWEDEERQRFNELMKNELRVGRAWGLKEAFRKFWAYKREWAAKRFFDRWYFRATHSRMQPVIKVAKTLKRHIDGLLAYTAHNITNAVSEGLNSKIQSVKANARGFRNFAHYRIAILFECGGLELHP